MSPIVIISGACAVALAVSALRRGADPIAPMRVFGIVWSVSIAMTELKLSSYQHTWSFYSWTIFLTGIAAFLIGILAVYAVFMEKPFLSIAEVRRRLLDQGRTVIDRKKFFRVIMVLFFAYLVTFGIETVIEGTVPLLSSRPDLLRVSFGVFGLHLIVNGMMGIVLLSVEYILVVPREGGRKPIVWLVVLVSVLTYFTLLQRYTFVVVATIVLAMTYYTSRRLRARVVVPLVALFISGMFWINFIRSARYIREYIYFISKMKFSKDYWLFAEPYMYVSMNLENFARAVDKLDHFTYGYFTFDWIMALAGLKHWMEQYFFIERLPFLISGYNTFTFHWWYYYDYGPIGVALLPFLTGVAIAWFYCQLRTSPSLLMLMLYACGVLVMAISFIMNPLNRLDFVSNVFLIWLVHRFLLRGPVVRAIPAPAGGASR